MAADVLLKDSIICRLCGESNNNGVNLFDDEDNSESLSVLVNRYLPLKIEDDDLFPKTVCPGCHIQLEATKLFMDLIIEGQAKLRSVLKAQQERFRQEEQKRRRLEEVLRHHNANASVETYTIKTDENGEKYIIQIYTDGPLFLPEHELTLKSSGLDKPKRKRGRPPKVQIIDEPLEEPEAALTCEETAVLDSTENETVESATGRSRRKIKPPARYDGVFQGRELVKVLKREGVIDEEVETLDEDEQALDGRTVDQEASGSATVIGKMVSVSDDSPTERLVYMKPRSKTRRKGAKLKYTCELCKKEFQHYGRYKLHKKNHEIKFKCLTAKCESQFDDREDIVEHQKTMGHEGISIIEIIDKINGTLLFNGDENILQEVVKEESSNETAQSLNCEECEKTFTCKQNLEVHNSVVHNGEKPYKCEICNKEFGYTSILKTHMLTHKSEYNDIGNTQNYKCDECDKVLQHPSSLMYHKETEHGHRQFICNKCNKSFKHRQLLMRHQLVHSEDRPFKCTECGRVFKTRTNLANHENIHKRMKKFICPICGNTFLHKTSLWVHLKWHDGNKPYECDVCKKAFSQKGNLIEHQRIHTGEQPFQCSECGRRFTTSSQCKQHVKRHTGVKPYGCKYCPKFFLHKEMYESHLRRHLGEKPFRCKFCPKAFPEKWACTRHERIHLGLKKYKCEVCDKAFSDVSNFSKHKKIHMRLHKSPTTFNKQAEDGNIEIDSAPINLLPIPENDFRDDTTTVIDPSEIRLHNILDNEGNSINFTTPDGQPIPIVSTGSDKLQAILPDGTLVSLDILAESSNSAEVTEEQEVQLFDSNIQFLEENSITQEDEKQPTLITEGNVFYCDLLP